MSDSLIVREDKCECMLTKMEKKAFCVLLAVTAVLIIFFLCFGVLYPEAGVVPYTEDTPEKTRVSFAGEIQEMRITAAGGHVLLNIAGVSVFVEGGADNIFYKTGDRVRVVGIVETYAGNREIVVGQTGSVSLATGVYLPAETNSYV